MSAAFGKTRVLPRVPATAQQVSSPRLLPAPIFVAVGDDSAKIHPSCAAAESFQSPSAAEPWQLRLDVASASERRDRGGVQHDVAASKGHPDLGIPLQRKSDAWSAGDAPSMASVQ